MARRKQVAPMQRINSGEVMESPSNKPERRAVYTNGHLQTPQDSHPPQTNPPSKTTPTSSPGIVQLVICVGGIYASFLTWGLLQERITTTPHPLPTALNPAGNFEYFRFPIFLNTIQSLFAFSSGTLYLITTTTTTTTATNTTTLFPSRSAITPLFLISLTTTLASPFGYASLSHVDYLTFVLAKSCKLLPVMFLHVVFYNKRYPLSKYLIVLAVTAGVAIFTLYHPPKPGKITRKPQTSSYYGLSLLGVNLLFDGLTNTTQDHVFSGPGSAQRYGKVTSAQMMAITNLFSFVLMSSYLLLTPYLPTTGTLIPSFARSGNTHELATAMAFLSRHPAVLYDVLGFCLCGAVGQLFIFATLERFSSLLLVTVTVTRKMLTMVLSVVWYGKSLTNGQWAGVALVFGGVGVEAWIQAEEKKAKARAKEVAGKKSQKELNGKEL